MDTDFLDSNIYKIFYVVGKKQIDLHTTKNFRFKNILFTSSHLSYTAKNSLKD